MNLFSKLSRRNRINHIFLIEDNEIYAKTLIHWIESQVLATKVHYFKVGELAVDSKICPDLVIVDYNLNDKYYDAENGLNIVAMLRERCKDVPGIFLTAQEEVEVAVAAAKQKNLFYVQKNAEALAKVVHLIDKIRES